MEKPDEGVKLGDENSASEQPADETNDQQVSEDVKNTGEEGNKPTADDLLKDDKRILVDKDRFNDRNDKAKLYEAFAPIIDKVKDDPELVEKLLETEKKGSLEDRVNRIENERKEQRRTELRIAVTDALSKWKGFETDWLELRDQVEMLAKRGLPFGEAIRRSYLALHPEKTEEESRRMAQDNANVLGQFQSGGGRAPKLKEQTEASSLNEREKRVAQDLMGKDLGDGIIPIKSEEDYARLLKKHEGYLKARGFYDLP